MKYKMINEKYGMPIAFASLDEMLDAIRQCGYECTELVEGVDYVIESDD